ncbi:MAG: DUF962 domain-containing protein [Gammaproteobacteria bacterium]|nr:DUF962 domain-containing protein [Gammaproteobacteria bacterium]
MRSLEEWFTEYAVSHRHPVNERLHQVCVPLIAVSLLALLWPIPLPAALAGTAAAANWASLVAAVALAYYALLSPALALGMLACALPVLALIAAAAGTGLPLGAVAATVFVLAWLGQLAGHRVEGRRPAFFRDLQFLLIGPLWVLAALYRRLGLSY